MHNANVYSETSENLEVLNGQEPAQEFRSIVSTRLPVLYRSAYRLLGNAADAEDAVQDALLAAYEHLDQFQGRSQMSTWLTAIVHNSARMQLRTQLRHTHVSLDAPLGEDTECSLSDCLADVGPNPEEECRQSELNKRLRHLTTQLSPTLLKTFQLRDVEGLSIRETAQILGVPNGTVKAQLARARKKLKRLMRRALRPCCRDLTHAHVQDVAA
jgi:RNA polymerase sigma-70 factor (ECF subfamily)